MKKMKKKKKKKRKKINKSKIKICKYFFLFRRNKC